MNQYYQSDRVTVFNCRFQEIYWMLPTDTLVILDPPYNIGFKYDQYKDTLPDEDYIEMLACLQRFERVVVIHYPVETMRLVVPALGVPTAVASWCYNANIPNRFRLVNFFGVKPDYSRVKQPYKNPKDKRVAQLIAKGSQGTNLYEWWDDIQLVKNVSAEKTGHPCPVPEALIRRIITLCANPGDVIFDPFGGSLTTCKAAMELGHRSIACEISENYIKEGLERIENSKRLEGM